MSYFDVYRGFGYLIAEAKGFSKRQLHHMKSHNRNELGRYEANQARRTNREIADYMDAKTTYDERMDPTNFRPTADRPAVASERAQQRRVASTLRTNADEMEGLEKQFTDARNVDANQSRPHPLRSVPKRKKK
jgi:hypothetical protein